MTHAMGVELLSSLTRRRAKANRAIYVRDLLLRVVSLRKNHHADSPATALRERVSSLIECTFLPNVTDCVSLVSSWITTTTTTIANVSLIDRPVDIMIDSIGSQGRTKRGAHQMG